MNKIRIIDLLNKIANGEQPKKIKYRNIIYNFEECKGDVGYINKDYGRYRWFVKEIECDLENGLNDEVEIIEEEHKIPEKIPLNYADDRKPEEVYEYLRCSYNQLIDYLKSKGE